MCVHDRPGLLRCAATQRLHGCESSRATQRSERLGTHVCTASTAMLHCDTTEAPRRAALYLFDTRKYPYRCGLNVDRLV